MATDLTLKGDIVLGGGVTAGGAVIGDSAAFVNACGAAALNSTGAITNPKAKMTAEGGYAIKLTNKTGAASVKGTIVAVKSDTDNAFDLVAIDGTDCIGVVYEAGIADAAECFVVIAGKAQVLMTNNATRGQMARIPLNTDTGEEAGKAVAAALPAAADIRHIGTILESKNAGTLCYVALAVN